MDFPRLFNLPLSRSNSLLMLLSLLWITACNSHHGVQEKELVKAPEEINEKAEDLIKNTLEDILQNPAKLPDSIKLKNAQLLQGIYSKNNFNLLWSTDGVFHQEADSLLSLVDSAEFYGLFPADYYQKQLNTLKAELQKNASKETKLDAAKWAYTDMLSTSAFIQLVKDLKMGRLRPDSVLKKDSSLQENFFFDQKQALKAQSLKKFTAALEPVNKDYDQLKEALKKFLPKANLRKYTLVKTKDSLLLPKLVYKRLAEEDSLKITADKKPDSTTIAKAVKKYQQWKKLKADGKITTALVNKLNTTDMEKFIRIAINLDKYKLLPQLPAQYVWVNIPAYYLEVRDGDSVVLTSKIICGKSITQTPQLTSVISDMITYPQWTIPESIIKKEILPALKKNAGYTQKKGYSVVDYKGNEIDPFTVNWAKYKNSIPYKVVQGSGDANALGVLKFNFSNPYAVYLHDTNQRYLFEKKSRALSHGCVRVHKWRELAYYILRKDSLANESKATSIDSLDSWLAQKKKQVVKVHQQLPLFIQYFSAEGRNGKLVMHEDIYEEDQRLREKIFAGK